MRKPLHKAQLALIELNHADEEHIPGNGERTTMLINWAQSVVHIMFVKDSILE